MKLALVETWPDGPGRRTAPVEVASRFSVARGRIVRIDRHADLRTAQAASGLTDADEVCERPVR